MFETESSEVSFGEILKLKDFRIDAEYYQRKYLSLLNQLDVKGYTLLGACAEFLIGPFGSSFDTENYVLNSDYRYVRGQDVKPFVLQDEGKRYIAKEDFDRLKKYSLRENDILVSVVGTLGNACIVSKEDLPAIFSCKSTVVRTKSIDPFFLITYLNSNVGKELLLRKQRGAIQKGLNLDDLKSLEVPNVSPELQEKIGELFKSGYKFFKESNLLYKKATLELEDILGIRIKDLPEENITIKKLSDSFLISGRLDSEYYQEKYDFVIRKLKAINSEELHTLCDIKKSIEPGSDSYKDFGVPFIRVSNITKKGITNPDIFLDATEFDLLSLMPTKNTILLSKDGSVGIAYKVQNDIEAITSSALLHLKLKDKKIDPDYLCLVLNSLVVQLQSERDAGGSIISHWKPDEIRNVLIPVLSEKEQTRLSEYVKSSFDMYSKSNQMFDLALKAVEELVYHGESEAMSFLKHEHHLIM